MAGGRRQWGGGQQGTERVRTAETQRRELPELHKSFSVMGRSPRAQEGTSGLWFPALKCLFKCVFERKTRTAGPAAQDPAGVMRSPMAWVSRLQGGRAPTLPLTPLLAHSGGQGERGQPQNRQDPPWPNTPGKQRRVWPVPSAAYILTPWGWEALWLVQN